MTLTDDDLARLRAATDRATPGPRQAAYIADAHTKDRMASAVKDSIDASDGDHYYGAFRDDGSEPPTVVAHTGNGPTSEANAVHIAAFDRETCLALLREVEAGRKLREAALAQRRWFCKALEMANEGYKHSDDCTVCLMVNALAAYDRAREGKGNG